jgi:hypothetical protein
MTESARLTGDYLVLIIEALDRLHSRRPQPSDLTSSTSHDRFIVSVARVSVRMVTRDRSAGP